MPFFRKLSLVKNWKMLLYKISGSLINSHTLFEYLDRREKLQNPDEQAKLLSEIPQVIAEDIELEPMAPDVPDKEIENNFEVLPEIVGRQASSLSEVPAVTNGLLSEATTVDIAAHDVKQESNSPKSILAGASEVPLCNMARNGTVLYHQYRDTDSAGVL